MPYDARVIQVLIASPSDVVPERDVVVDVIREWNAVNSQAQGIALLPLMWETHATPESNPPQTALNRQFVDRCDLAIGVFWTKIGTPTENAESGTVEEIVRVRAANKPVMLYFSRKPIDPTVIDGPQLDRLMTFKTNTAVRTYYGEFNSLEDFRRQLVRQLALAVQDVIANDNPQPPRTEERDIVLDLVFANGETVRPLRDGVEMKKIVCGNEDSLPDYTVQHVSSVSLGTVSASFASPAYAYSSNRNYYREVVEYYKSIMSSIPVRVALTNEGDIALEGVLIEIRIPKDQSFVISRSEPVLPPSPASTMIISGGFVDQFARPMQLTLRDSETTAEWILQAEFPIVQSGRQVATSNPVWLHFEDDTRIRGSAKLFSSQGRPRPFELAFQAHVTEERMDFQAILANLNIEIP